MTRRDWWLGVVAVVAAVLVHALVPRYDWRGPYGRELLRLDRWTGRAVLGEFNTPGQRGRWTAVPGSTFQDDLNAVLAEPTSKK